MKVQFLPRPRSSWDPATGPHLLLASGFGSISVVALITRELMRNCRVVSLDDFSPLFCDHASETRTVSPARSATTWLPKEISPPGGRPGFCIRWRLRSMVCDLSTGRVGISAGKIAAGSPLCQGLMVETLPASDAGVVLRQFQASGVLLHALLLICDRLWSGSTCWRG